MKKHLSFFLYVRLFYTVNYEIILLKLLICLVSTSNQHTRGGYEKMKKREYNIKILRYISLILLLLTILVQVIKK